MSENSLYNEQQLLEKMAEGDEQAFTALYNKHYAHIYYFAKRIVDDELAKDVTIEVFTKLWSNRTRFENTTHFVAYLRKLARNSCIDKLRRLSAETQKKTELVHLSDDQYEDTYFKDLLEASFYRRIAEAVEKLPGHQQAIFRLAFYEGLKNSEIAERLSIKDASVRVGKAEAIKHLRIALLNTDLLAFLSFIYLV